VVCDVYGLSNKTEYNATFVPIFLADRRVPVQISGNVGEQIRQRLSVRASYRIRKCLGALQG